MKNQMHIEYVLSRQDECESVFEISVRTFGSSAASTNSQCALALSLSVSRSLVQIAHLNMC